MTAPATKRAQTTARVAALRERRLALGLTRLELYARPEHHARIKAYAARLTEKPAESKPGG